MAFSQVVCAFWRNRHLQGNSCCRTIRHELYRTYVLPTEYSAHFHVGRDDPTALFYFFGPLTASGEPRYEFVIAYIYMRAIAFTTNIMLHWGLTLTVLLTVGVVWSSHIT